MSAKTPFAVVLRFWGFSLSQVDLETRLKTPVERYSSDKDGYAQISVESDEPDWKVIDDLLQKHGSAVKTLRDSGDVRSVYLDLAWAFREGSMMVSYSIPAQTAALAGMHRIDMEFSIYYTTP